MPARRAAAILRACSSRFASEGVFPRTVSQCVQELIDRGVVRGSFPDTLLENGRKAELLDGVPRCVYTGFDPTADSLHLGNLVVLCTLLRFNVRGFCTVVVLGGATARLGDPSGQAAERPLRSGQELADNCRNIERQLRRVFANFSATLHQPRPPLVLNNADWLDRMSVTDFYGTVGRHFRLRHLMDKQSVRERLKGEGINFAEFSYQIFQALDWLHLYKLHGCLLQLGGVDQTGNIHSGHDLIRSVYNRCAYGLLTPLLTSDSGEKLGKSTGCNSSNIWLCPRRTSAYKFYQHFATLPDSRLSQYYRLFSFISNTDIDDLLSKHMEKPEQRWAQHRLAKEVTTLVHGDSALQTVLSINEILHEGKLDRIKRMNEAELDTLEEQVPTKKLRFHDHLTIAELAIQAGCFNETSTAGRVIRQGGFYVNGCRMNDPAAQLTQQLAFALARSLTVLRVGRKEYHLVSWIA